MQNKTKQNKKKRPQQRTRITSDAPLWRLALWVPADHFLVDPAGLARRARGAAPFARLRDLDRHRPVRGRGPRLKQRDIGRHWRDTRHVAHEPVLALGRRRQRRKGRRRRKEPHQVRRQKARHRSFFSFLSLIFGPMGHVCVWRRNFCLLELFDPSLPLFIFGRHLRPSP
jgi:hypothetical protein